MSKLVMLDFLWHPENVGSVYVSQGRMVSFTMV